MMKIHKPFNWTYKQGAMLKHPPSEKFTGGVEKEVIYKYFKNLSTLA